MKYSKSRISSSRFSIGDVVHHKLFDYRGVIVDIDAEFRLSDEWYNAVARSKPPKNEPWYHILVDQASNSTYVAEQNLEPDNAGNKISHPMVDQFFSDFKNGRYINSEKTN